MNYPLWDIPAPGLLIALVAIVHVFISHFAVGGGLFLVLTERKARREGDAALLTYVERHSKFFALLTLVAGALTGVGIWFTIALVHPAAVSTLVTSFVWGWAIEWTFFVTEITAAIIYALGWTRLSPKTHLRVGWIYFGAAWLSLVVINGILSFMLTPGEWLATRDFWDGVLNPTYYPSLVARTAGAVGLAGVYALLTASWMTQGDLKIRVARYAAGQWILPAAALLPLSLWWYLSAAGAAGIPLAEVFGSRDASIVSIVRAAFTATTSGHPVAQNAAAVFVMATAGLILTALVVLAWRHGRYGRLTAAAAMTLAFAMLGAAEFIREDLRKPYVITGFMFVTGTSPDQEGVLAHARWARPVAVTGDDTVDAIARGHEVFRLSCAACHTQSGYLGIRPLAAGISVAGATGMLGRMDTWRGRMMPPFQGTPEERRDLAHYLAAVGGMTPAAIARAERDASAGARLFDENCSVCHGADGEYPLTGRGRNIEELKVMLTRLPEVNDAMPAFEGSDDDRRALAAHIVTLEKGVPGGVQ